MRVIYLTALLCLACGVTEDNVAFNLNRLFVHVLFSFLKCDYSDNILKDGLVVLSLQLPGSFFLCVFLCRSLHFVIVELETANKIY